jgi:MFS family permease
MDISQKDRSGIIALSVISFLTSFQLGFTTYVDSSFLSTLLSRYFSYPETYVGYIFTIVALATFSLFLFTPKLLRKFGNRRIALVSACVLPFSLATLSLQPHILLTIIAFTLASLAVTLLYTTSDIFMNAYTKSTNEAFVRSIYFTASSLGFMLSPALAGYLAATYSFSLIYVSAAIAAIPIAFVILKFLRGYTDASYEDVPALPSREMRKHTPDLIPVFIAHAALQVFYSVMTVYAPIFLIQHAGLHYNEFGLIITIALSAFIILPVALGYIADRYIGEKEFIITGTIIMGASLLLLPVFAKTPQSLLVWGALLFVSRIGAAASESMTDAFFFKKIEHVHPSYIAFYRRARPTALLFTPALCSLLLLVPGVTIPHIFLITGMLVLLTLFSSLQLRDTK